MEEKHPRENTEKFETTKAIPHTRKNSLLQKFRTWKQWIKRQRHKFYYMLQIANLLWFGTVKKWCGKGEHFLHVENNIDELDYLPFNRWGNADSWMVVEKWKKSDAFLIRLDASSHFMEASNIYRRRPGNLIRFLRRLGLHKTYHCLIVHENVELYTYSVPFFDSCDVLGC